MTSSARPSQGSAGSRKAAASCDRRKRSSGKGKEKRSRSRDTAAIFAFELDVFIRTCRSIDTPRSLACALLAQAGEWTQYLELSFPDPASLTFADDYLVTEMLSKNPRLPLKVDKAAVAIQKFLESEEVCAATNARFSSYYATPTESYRELHWISQVQRILCDALGPLSAKKLESLGESFRFGPGSTSCIRGSDVLTSRKYTAVKHVTPRLRPYIAAVTGAMKGEVVVIDASRVITVSKNAKTDRTICIEPHANIYFQLGVGALIRSVLTRLGLDPNNQGRNREMAQHAVKRGYATIDLSMASDTIATEVVGALVPDDWFHLLMLGRTDKTVLPDGKEILLEKFSSMGNGFTWELETLLFYAVCRTLTTEDIGVFGDDLVVPVAIVGQLIERLEFFGFKTNSRKSFWQGDFRESCGEDWWLGLNVRPFYLRKETDAIWSLPHYAISVANAIRMYAHQRGDRLFCDQRFLPIWLYAKRRTDEYCTTATSFGYGDDGIIKNFDEAAPSKSRRKPGYQGYRGIVARRRPIVSKNTCVEGAYLAALDRGSAEASRTEEYVRKRTSRPRTEVVLVFDWYDLGPWM